jgi:formate dehydrogenase maturation protein FdhE
VAKPKRIVRPGYPLPNYNGHTVDVKHCPNCGSTEVALLSGFTSGQRIGICNECAANYIVEPEANHAN